MVTAIEKITAFVTRETVSGIDLLLFEHPYAGIQIPAGTVNQGETPLEAALREVAEETGLSPVEYRQYLGVHESDLPADQAVICTDTRVYARPDTTSFDWAHLRRGITVSIGMKARGFTHIAYEEFDRFPDPQYVTFSIKGWVPDEVTTGTISRHFYHLGFNEKSEDRWTIFSDNHTFSPFWSSLDNLPEIVPPQDQWLGCLKLDQDDKHNPVSDNCGTGT
jgi:8-oxo-dGTP pyrophosphatase MutT (NUDIX family)